MSTFPKRPWPWLLPEKRRLSPHRRVSESVFGYDKPPVFGLPSINLILSPILCSLFHVFVLFFFWAWAPVSNKNHDSHYYCSCQRLVGLDVRTRGWGIRKKARGKCQPCLSTHREGAHEKDIEAPAATRNVCLLFLSTIQSSWCDIKLSCRKMEVYFRWKRISSATKVVCALKLYMAIRPDKPQTAGPVFAWGAGLKLPCRGGGGQEHLHDGSSVDWWRDKVAHVFWAGLFVCDNDVIWRDVWAKSVAIEVYGWVFSLRKHRGERRMMKKNKEPKNQRTGVLLGALLLIQDVHFFRQPHSSFKMVRHCTCSMKNRALAFRRGIYYFVILLGSWPASSYLLRRKARRRHLKCLVWPSRPFTIDTRQCEGGYGCWPSSKPIIPHSRAKRFSFRFQYSSITTHIIWFFGKRGRQASGSVLGAHGKATGKFSLSPTPVKDSLAQCTFFCLAVPSA